MSPVGPYSTGLRPWQVRVILAFIAAVPLILASTLFSTDHAFWRDVVKDFGIIIAGLLVVSLVWAVVGGDPIENAIQSLNDETRRMTAQFGRMSNLMVSAEGVGLIALGADSSAFLYQPEQLLRTIEHSTSTISLCGLTLLILHENHSLVNALKVAAKRGVKVRILLSAEDNPWLPASNEETAIPAMAGVILGTIAALKSTSVEGDPNFQVRKLRKKTLTISLLQFDDLVIATPYLTSTMTPSSPRFVAKGAESPLYKAWLREFDYLFAAAEPAW